MRILLTNDDGIDAPGLQALRTIAAELSDDLWIVAPESNQSGSSHSLSLNEPLRMREVTERVYAVRGTPTDSVIMAVRHVLKDKAPDLVLSGVNRGANLADDVSYSGTIAGAFEGTQLGIRSLALSQSLGTDTYSVRSVPRWETALAYAPGLIRKLLEEVWPPGLLMNINFPACAPDDVAGIMVTRQGKRDQNLLHIEQRHDTWGNPYYWLGFERRRSNAARDTDLWAIYNNFVSVTPLYMNLTHAEMLERLQARLSEQT
jgi:5'-nucleotidase